MTRGVLVVIYSLAIRLRRTRDQIVIACELSCPKTIVVCPAGGGKGPMLRRRKGVNRPMVQCNTSGGRASDVYIPDQPFVHDNAEGQKSYWECFHGDVTLQSKLHASVRRRSAHGDGLCINIC